MRGQSDGTNAEIPIDIVVLVKPQFEVGKGEVGKGGIVREPAKRLRALEAVSEFARQAGFVVAGSIPSPVAGSGGKPGIFIVPSACKGAMIHAMNPKVRKIGIIFKQQDARVRDIAGDIIPWLQSRGVEVFVDKAAADQCPGSAGFAPPEELVGMVEIVCVFGGDGTLLYAARLIGAKGVPILGINLGSLGFLTEVKLDEMHAAFEGLLSGRIPSGRTRAFECGGRPERQCYCAIPCAQ